MSTRDMPDESKVLQREDTFVLQRVGPEDWHVFVPEGGPLIPAPESKFRLRVIGEGTGLMLAAHRIGEIVKLRDEGEE